MCMCVCVCVYEPGDQVVQGILCVEWHINLEEIGSQEYHKILISSTISTE